MDIIGNFLQRLSHLKILDFCMFGCDSLLPLEESELFLR